MFPVSLLYYFSLTMIILSSSKMHLFTCWLLTIDQNLYFHCLFAVVFSSPWNLNISGSIILSNPSENEKRKLMENTRQTISFQNLYLKRGWKSVDKTFTNIRKTINLLLNLEMKWNWQQVQSIPWNWYNCCGNYFFAVYISEHRVPSALNNEHWALKIEQLKLESWKGAEQVFLLLIIIYILCLKMRALIAFKWIGTNTHRYFWSRNEI